MKINTVGQLVSYLNVHGKDFTSKSNDLWSLKWNLRMRLENACESISNYKFRFEKYGNDNIIEFKVYVVVGTDKIFLTYIKGYRTKDRFKCEETYTPWGSNEIKHRTYYVDGYKISKVDFVYPDEERKSRAIQDVIDKHYESIAMANERAEQGRIKGLEILSENGFTDIEQFAKLINAIVPNLTPDQKRELGKSIGYNAEIKHCY